MPSFAATVVIVADALTLHHHCFTAIHSQTQHRNIQCCEHYADVTQLCICNLAVKQSQVKYSLQQVS